jgi:hypothetical protein
MRALLTDQQCFTLLHGPDHPDVSEGYYYKTRQHCREKIDNLERDLLVLLEAYPEEAERIFEIVEDVQEQRAQQTLGEPVVETE